MLPRRQRQPRRVLRSVVRAGAFAAIAAAAVVPFIRNRRGIRAEVTIAATVAAPLAIAVLWPRSRRRDVALYAAQMWAFAVAHELPYDDPVRLRERLHINYPVRTDSLIGAGTLPTVRLQRGLARLGRANLLDRALTWVHWLWFFEPYVALVWILLRHPERFPRAARQMAATFDVGCLIYFAVPTAPPWWSSEQGFTDERVRRIMVEVGEETWGAAWPRMYGALGGNPWAAMPSLHFATSLMAAIHLAEAGREEGVVGWAYALTLGFALVYLGEHYVTDLAAGTALVAGVRAGEPVAEPAVLAVNRGLQRLERIAGAG